MEPFLTTLAYCFAFGTILVKVGRVYHIFNNPTEKKKVRESNVFEHDNNIYT